MNVRFTNHTDETDPRLLDEQMMRRAIALADQAAAMGEVPIGAVVFRGQTILAEAANRRETDHDPTAHAEIIALREAARALGSWRLIGCTLAVTLEPCAMCAGAIVNARIDRLVYGASDPKAGAVASLYEICSDSRLNHRPQIVRGILDEQCGKLLREFFINRRNQFK